MAFVEGKLPEAKLYNNDVFPKTLLPAAGSHRNLANAVIAERDDLVAALRRHRALLFRGFDVASVDEFDRVVEAFDWENCEIIQGANRVKLSDRIYTTSEYPTETPISFHHEYALREGSPSKIFFYCSEISPEGGETSIVASDVVVEKMEERMPEVMAKVAEVGLIHVFKMFNDGDGTAKGVHNKRWQSFLGTDDEVEANKRSMELLHCNATQFFSDVRAEFVFGPLNPVVKRDEKRAWLIALNGFSDNADLVSNKFGDGNDFPSEAGDTYRRILEENCVDIKWQKGDVLLLNNFAVQHARRPGKPPRCVLVSMCK